MEALIHPCGMPSWWTVSATSWEDHRRHTDADHEILNRAEFVQQICGSNAGLCRVCRPWHARPRNQQTNPSTGSISEMAAFPDRRRLVTATRITTPKGIKQSEKPWPTVSGGGDL
jgi:hypothetical protein